MPSMPRVKGKATKIAYSILGEPNNMVSKPISKRKRQLNSRLEFEYNSRVR